MQVPSVGNEVPKLGTKVPSVGIELAALTCMREGNLAGQDSLGRSRVF